MSARTIRFDPRSVQAVDGGMVVVVDSFAVPTGVQLVETRSVVTVTIHGTRPRSFRPRRYARHEVFVPLQWPLTARRVIDGSDTTEQRTHRAA